MTSWVSFPTLVQSIRVPVKASDNRSSTSRTFSPAYSTI